jgi:hypothetical protein
MTAKTFSGAIAAQGWSGEVLTEERPGRNGSETFVKQPPKEGGFTPQFQKSAPAVSSPKREFDNFTMYLSYAKDLVVALQNTEGYNQESFEKLLEATIKGGKALYAHRPGGEADVPAPVQDTIVSMDDAVPLEAISNEELNKLFPIGD